MKLYYNTRPNLGSRVTHTLARQGSSPIEARLRTESFHFQKSECTPFHLNIHKTNIKSAEISFSVDDKEGCKDEMNYKSRD